MSVDKWKSILICYNKMNYNVNKHFIIINIILTFPPINNLSTIYKQIICTIINYFNKEFN